MTCPHCNLKNTSVVIDARITVNKIGESKRRRRQCQICKSRFTTYEFAAQRPRRNAPGRGKTVNKKVKPNPEPPRGMPAWLQRIQALLAQ